MTFSRPHLSALRAWSVLRARSHIITERQKHCVDNEAAMTAATLSILLCVSSHITSTVSHIGQRQGDRRMERIDRHVHTHLLRRKCRKMAVDESAQILT